ncbi:MAG: TRAP transporter substrate-binding protein DctP [Verrucomicrobia bacterium]|nr:TRAP transporter substrate-binding protein DctP [Verrucomicrobiota bacterium]
MNLRLLLGVAAAALLAPTLLPAQPKTFKIAHQFPGGTADEGDFRDRLCRKFAAEVEKRTNGQLKFEIYANNSLFKSDTQFTAMQRGGLEMCLIPLAYMGGKIPEVNLTLMPGLISSYEQGHRWKSAPIGAKLNELLDKNDVKIVTWVWQAGGIANTGSNPILVPDDVKGLKIRGASKDMDLMLKTAGGSVTSMPSSEVYNAMSSKVLDAAVTSSTSLLSFRLYEHAKSVTTARQKTFWFMFEPLLIGKTAWNSLTPEQQKIVMEVGASLEQFGIDAAKADDTKLAEVYGKAGVKVADMNEEQFQKWVAVARESSWKDFEKTAKDGATWLKLATDVK